MKRARTFLLLGVWIAILPYLGFPYSWKQVLFTISGLAVMYMAYVLYKQNKMPKEKPHTFNNFSENSEFKENRTQI